VTGMIGLLKMELPGRTVLLCDGGFITFAGETYTASDAVLGTVGGVETPAEGAGGDVPAASITFLPITADVATLADPAMQGSRVRFWMAFYDEATGTITGTPDLQFDGQVDQVTLSGGSVRELDVSVVSTGERLFEGNLGNSLNSAWHKGIWPGELGHDNATGLSVPVAWGTERPAAVGQSAGTGGGGSGNRGARR
jgi:hypothetical protein